MFSSQLLASDRNIAGMKHFYLSSHPPILCGWITSGSRLSLYGGHEMSILFSALFYTTGSRIGTIPSVVYCKPNRLMDKHYLSQIHCSQFRLGCLPNIFFDSSPKGEGSAVSPSAARFDSSWNRCCRSEAFKIAGCTSLPHSLRQRQ